MELYDISEILKQLPKELQAKALGDIESLASNIKGTLVKSEESEEENVPDDDLVVEDDILGSINTDTIAKTETDDLVQSIGTPYPELPDFHMNISPVPIVNTRKSTRRTVAKRHADFIVDLPGKKSREDIKRDFHPSEKKTTDREIDENIQNESVLANQSIQQEHESIMDIGEELDTQHSNKTDTHKNSSGRKKMNVLSEQSEKINKKSGKRERCLVCMKKCKDKVSLREHMQSAHKIKMEVNTPKTSTKLVKSPKSKTKQKIEKKIVDSVSENNGLDGSEKAEEILSLAGLGCLNAEALEIDEEKESNAKDASDKENVKKKCGPKTKKEKEDEKEEAETAEDKTDEYGYQCPMCDKRLAKEIGLKQHMSRFHASELSTTCDICDKHYTTYKRLLSHKRIVHGKKRFYCDQCSYATKHSLDLKRHIIRAHRGVKDYPYECVDCGKRFITTTTLRKHSEVHDTNRPMQNCKYDGCQFSTRSTMSMTIHLRNKHLGLQKTFECEFCGKKLGAKVTYETHLRRHKGQYIFRCIKCPAAFPCRTQLSAHAAIHGEKTEECQLCGKKFSSKAKVQRHLMVHSGEKKHSCPWCQYKCNLDTNLRKHCCARHNIEYPPKRRPVVRLEYAGQEEGESLNHNEKNLRFDKLPKKIMPNILRKQQKVEFVLSRSEDGSVDTAEIVKFLESQGFYGQQMIQVEVAGQTFIINCNKKKIEPKGNEPTGTSTAETVTMKTPVVLQGKDLEDVASQFTNNSNTSSSIINKYTMDDTGTIKYNLGTGEPEKFNMISQATNQVTDVSGLLPLHEIKMEVENTANVQLSSNGGIDNVDGECILSEEALQQITMLGDSNNTVIVIQQPDGTYQVQQSQPSTLSTTSSQIVDSSSVIELGNSEVVPQEQYEITVGKSTSSVINEGIGQDGGTCDNSIVSESSYDVIYANVKDHHGGFEMDSEGQVVLTSGVGNTEELSQEQVEQMLVVDQEQI